jgi:hypothetical protein
MFRPWQFSANVHLLDSGQTSLNAGLGRPNPNLVSKPHITLGLMKAA